MAIIGLLFVAAFLIVAASIINGFVLSILWQWFLVPFGLPAIGVAWAIGIALIVGMLTKQDGDSVQQERSAGEAIGVALGRIFVGPFFVLFVGWVAHSFM